MDYANASDIAKHLTAVDQIDLTPIGAILDELQLLDDEPQYDEVANPEIDPQLRLSADRRFVRTPKRRLFVDYRSNPDAFRHLDPLPSTGESLHGVISGKYALFDLLPATIERSGQRVIELYLLTLGFSKQNGADLCGLLDDEYVSNLTLIPSHYFKNTSAAIYDAVVPEVLARGQKVFAIRNHAKMILAKLADGTCYSVESSANLRSCNNVETFVMTNDVELYDHHRTWIEDEIVKPSEAKRKRRGKREQTDSTNMV